MIIEPIHCSRINFISFGQIDLTGSLAKDSYIEIAPASDITSYSIDAGGYAGSISRMSDNSAEVTLQLQVQSSANMKLLRMYAQDRITSTVTIQPIVIEAGGSVFLFDLTNCFMKSLPTESKSADMADATNTWVFTCMELVPKTTAQSAFSVTAQATIDEQVTLTGAINILF